MGLEKHNNANTQRKIVYRTASYPVRYPWKYITGCALLQNDGKTSDYVWNNNLKLFSSTRSIIPSLTERIHGRKSLHSQHIYATKVRISHKIGSKSLDKLETRICTLSSSKKQFPLLESTLRHCQIQGCHHAPHCFWTGLTGKWRFYHFRQFGNKNKKWCNILSALRWVYNIVWTMKS